MTPRFALAALMTVMTSYTAVPGPVSAQAHEPPAAPVTLFDYDAEAPLDYRETAVPAPVAGLEMYEIRYLGSSGAEVTGLLAVPERGYGRGFFGRLAGRVFGEPGRPAILVMHGMPGTARQAMAGWGLALAQRGAVTLAIDAPWSRRGGEPLRMTPQDSVEQVTLIRDLRRAVDILAAREDVDPDRIAYTGVSYGGAMGALLVGVEPRLAAAVLRVGGAGLVSRLTDAAGNPEEELAQVGPEQRARWLAAMTPIEPRRFIHGAAGTSVLYLAGRTDPFVPEDDSRAIIDRAPEPKTVRWYDAGHALTAAADDDMIVWLAERVGISKEVQTAAVPEASDPPPAIRDSARVYARWFRNGHPDSLWMHTHPRVRERYPDLEAEYREVSLDFRRDVGDSELRVVAERFVWRNDRRQFWQTLAVGDTGREVVLRLVLFSSGAGGVAGWGWDHPDRTPPIDSAGPAHWPH